LYKCDLVLCPYVICCRSPAYPSCVSGGRGSCLPSAMCRCPCRAFSQTASKGLELLVLIPLIFGWQLLCLTLLNVGANWINRNIFTGISRQKNPPCAQVVCRTRCLQKVAEPSRGSRCMGQGKPWPCSEAGAERRTAGSGGPQTSTRCPCSPSPAASPWRQRDLVIYWCDPPRMRERLSSGNAFDSAVNKKGTRTPWANLQRNFGDGFCLDK